MRNRKFIVPAVGLVLLIGLALLWRFTPLADLLRPDQMARRLEAIQRHHGAPFIFLVAYVLGGVVMFPVTVMSATTAIIFPPLIAASISFSGIVVSAAITHWIGARFLREWTRSALGATIKRVDEALADRGIITIAAIRMVPLAPFTLVNLAAGALGVGLRDYMLGTVLGIAPGTILVCLFGRQVRHFWKHPSGEGVALVVGVIIVWIAVSLSLQRWAARRRGAAAH
jgi:uncharacterized membrane protein YdjX (TVP38/TMEM64 family)